MHNKLHTFAKSSISVVWQGSEWSCPEVIFKNHRENQLKVTKLMSWSSWWTCSMPTIKHHNDINDAILVSLLLTLNILRKISRALINSFPLNFGHLFDIKLIFLSIALNEFELENKYIKTMPMRSFSRFVVSPFHASIPFFRPFPPYSQYKKTKGF